MKKLFLDEALVIVLQTPLFRSLAAEKWCLALLFLWACPSLLAAAEDPFTFVQISDLHLPAEPDSGCDAPAAEYLRRAIQEINALSPPPRFVIFTGDIAKDRGEPEAYAMFKACLLALHVPVRFALGNHDDRANFRRLLLGENKPGVEPYYYSFRQGRYFFVVLDSTKPGALEGELDNKQLAWLKAELSAHVGRETVIFMHHQSYPVGRADDFILKNRYQFLAALKPFPQVRLVASGHVHLPSFLKEQGRYFVTTGALIQGSDPVTDVPGYSIFSLTQSKRPVVVYKQLGGKDL